MRKISSDEYEEPNFIPPKIFRDLKTSYSIKSYFDSPAIHFKKKTTNTQNFCIHV